jgi:hypothetical protein
LNQTILPNTRLSAAIAKLSPEHREVLLMKDIDGLKYEDIAEVLGVPIGTIRSRLHRARLELRDLLVPLEERTEAHGSPSDGDLLTGDQGGSGAIPQPPNAQSRRARRD